MNYYFITGTSRGIGFAIATELLKNNNNKVFGYGRKSSIQHANYSHITIDLSDIRALLNFEFPVINEAETICLINNSGTIGEIKPCGKLDNKNIVQTLNLNLIAPSILCNQFLKKYQNYAAKKYIINISSGAAKFPIDAWSAYCASKAGLDLLSLTIQEEQNLRNGNVKVFAISPGVIDTAMQDEIRKANPDDFKQYDYFHKLKINNDLIPPDLVAKKIIHILQSPRLQDNVLIALKDIVL
ncbi:MAG: SDR family NAD(P)-dependent oxidoreductase [Bacteroidia bacterium]